MFIFQIFEELTKKNTELLREVGNLQAERDAMYERLMCLLQTQQVNTE